MNPDLIARLEEATYPNPKHTNLSELVRACGYKFHFLQLLGSGAWIAIGRDTELHGKGMTPEEAVAELWLLIRG
jgi:hypothetical protein